MKYRLLLLAATASLFVSTAATAESIAASLSVSPASVLRGLPAAFSVTITNTSSDPQIVADYAALHVSSASGASFVASAADRESFSFPESAKCASIDVGKGCMVLAAGGSVSVYFDFTSRLDGNPFFMDPRLSTPGQYTLQLELMVDHLSAGPERILSTSATFVIVDPTGDDAVFWRSVMQRGKGGTTWSSLAWPNVGSIVAKDAYASTVTTAYTPWLAGLVEGMPNDVLAAYARALGASPNPALRDALLLGEARFLNQASRNAVWAAFDVDGGVAYADLARGALNDLIRVTTVPVLRDQAGLLLAQLLTPATANDLLRSHLADEPPAPLPIQPIVICVRPGQGNSFTALFGYMNPNKSGKVLLIGNDNQVTPAPRDQGQPRVFRPGRQLNAFTASSPGGELKWHLDGNVATATPAFPTQCAPTTAGSGQ